MWLNIKMCGLCQRKIIHCFPKLINKVVSVKITSIRQYLLKARETFTTLLIKKNTEICWHLWMTRDGWFLRKNVSISSLHYRTLNRLFRKQIVRRHISIDWLYFKDLNKHGNGATKCAITISKILTSSVVRGRVMIFKLELKFEPTTCYRLV